LSNRFDCHTVGVISDTHGYLRPEAVEALQGVELILHAGDVDEPEILEELGAIAPVLAVRGNVDYGVWAERLPICRDVQVQEAKIHMRHILEDVTVRPGEAQVIITGHSHRVKVVEEQGTIYLNPGSAGPRRFTLPVTLARLRVTGARVMVEVVELEV
jgi:uncharacterized protein